MFGLPAAFYVDDDNRRREAISRRASLANAAEPSNLPQGSISLPASRIPSRANSRKPSLSGLNEFEGEIVSHPRTVSHVQPL